jgi:hypothetical protein
MAKPHGKQVTIDENSIREVRDRLLDVRNQISTVRGGVNPNDSGHPRGYPLGGIKLKTGSGNFPSGQDMASRIGAIGSAIDQKLATVDQRLSGYAQSLDHILASADHVELANMSLADFGDFVGGTSGAGSQLPPV